MGAAGRSEGFLAATAEEPPNRPLKLSGRLRGQQLNGTIVGQTAGCCRRPTSM
jgi:hypothetical protein